MRSRSRCAIAFMTIKSSGVASGTVTPATRTRFARETASTSNGSEPSEMSMSISLGRCLRSRTLFSRAKSRASGWRGEIPNARPLFRKSFHRLSSSSTRASISRVTRGRPTRAIANPPIKTPRIRPDRHHCIKAGKGVARGPSCRRLATVSLSKPGPAVSHFRFPSRECRVPFQLARQVQECVELPPSGVRTGKSELGNLALVDEFPAPLKIANI